MEYVLPIFDRGTGLGNRLFPWARAVLYARDHDVQVMPPFWPRWTTTGLVRGGITYRHFLGQISLLGAFKRSPTSVTIFEKYKTLATALTIPEDAPVISQGSHDYVRTFAGELDHFRSLNGRNIELLKEYEAIVHPRWRALVEQYKIFTIGINVRRGKDFRDPLDENEYYTSHALRTPLHWFVRSLRFVRSILGEETPALLVSDGSASDLLEILEEGHVSILRPGCASSDLLALSYAKVLLGSGGSSFSAWASFFARCPTVTIHGQSARKMFSLEHEDSIYHGDFNPAAPPTLFCENLLSLRRHLSKNGRRALPVGFGAETRKG